MEKTNYGSISVTYREYSCQKTDIRDSKAESSNRSTKKILNDVQRALAQKIETIAQAMGVDPSKMVSIAHQESKLNAQAKSSAGAVGVMQLLCGETSPAMDMCKRCSLYQESFSQLGKATEIISSIKDPRAKGIIQDMTNGKFKKYDESVQQAGGNILNNVLKQNADINLNIIIGCAYIKGIGKMVEKKNESEDTKKIEDLNNQEISDTCTVVEYFIKNGIPQAQHGEINQGKLQNTIRTLLESIGEYRAEDPKSQATMQEFMSLCRYNGQKNLDNITVDKKKVISPLAHRAIYALTIMTKNRLNLFQE